MARPTNMPWARGGLATLLAVAALSLLTGCQQDRAPDPEASAATTAEPAPGETPTPASVDSPAGDVVEVPERWLSARDERDNVDSVAVWDSGDGRAWLLATAKEGHAVIVHDAATGAPIERIGGPGDAPGRFRRPNGIFVHADHAFVVERDNRRVQVLSLPEFESLGTFGEQQLARPYGLWLYPRPGRADGALRVFVTDQYETPNEQVPPDAELDRRLQRFDLAPADNGGYRVVEHAVHGPVAGPGRLLKVESLWGDPESDRLLVAEEHASALALKAFDLAGNYQDRNLAEDALRHEPEGIALYACRNGGGYWIVTDQDEIDNRFLVFARDGFEPLGAFTGRQTRNTDGVWLHPHPLEGFPAGAFYAVHNDGNVAAFDIAEILDALGLAACPVDNGPSGAGQAR